MARPFATFKSISISNRNVLLVDYSLCPDGWVAFHGSCYLFPYQKSVPFVEAQVDLLFSFYALLLHLLLVTIYHTVPSITDPFRGYMGKMLVTSIFPFSHIALNHFIYKTVIQKQ